MDEIRVACCNSSMPDALKLTPEMLEMMRREGAARGVKVSRFSACVCGKLLDVTDWQRKFHSGRFYKGKQIAPGINYTDLLCEDCRREFAGWPRIVCLGCRDLMGFYKPGVQATGFEFERNRHYHILDCPKCNPRRPSTPVIEHEQFCKARGIKTLTDPDLVKEIETKILQAELAAEKFRAEIRSSSRT